MINRFYVVNVHAGLLVILLFDVVSNINMLMTYYRGVKSVRAWSSTDLFHDRSDKKVRMQLRFELPEDCNSNATVSGPREGVEFHNIVMLSIYTTRRVK